MASTVFYGFIVTYVLRKTPLARKVTATAAIVMIGLVCFSRVYLGLHYVSDVLGGTLMGIAWSILVVTVLDFPHAKK